jgi:hypothetical protein
MNRIPIDGSSAPRQPICLAASPGATGSKRQRVFQTPRNTTPTPSEDVVVQHDQKTCTMDFPQLFYGPQGCKKTAPVWFAKMEVDQMWPNQILQLNILYIIQYIYNTYIMYISTSGGRCRWLPPASVNAFTVASKISRGVAAFTGTTRTSVGLYQHLWYHMIGLW